MVFANDFFGETDSEILENALSGRDRDGILVIGPKVDGEAWLLDRALLLPKNTTVILRNCKLKLSDRCRDNFFRTDNCGINIEKVAPTSNIHIIGEGHVVLEGADHPRATGDGSKILSNPCPYLRGKYITEESLSYAQWIPEDRRRPGLLTPDDRHSHSYGTDAGKDGESPKGDWRGIGILFANIENFSIENITIRASHGWGISIESGSFGQIRHIHFDDLMYKEIDGLAHNMENQDGIDLRNGCHDILITDITGKTGDDVVALTAIAVEDVLPGGRLGTTHIMENDWTKRDRGIYNVTIRNVTATSACCWLVRLLAVNSQIRNIVIDGIVDTSTDRDHTGTILLGDDGVYGKNPDNGIDSVIISNVVSNAARAAINIWGGIENSLISNVINKNPTCECIECRETVPTKQVTILNAITVV